MPNQVSDRIRHDYKLTQDILYQFLQSSLKDLTPDEYERWIQAGWLDHREIDGKLCFFDSAPSNLFFRHPELNSRRIDPPDETERARTVLKLVRAIKDAAKVEQTPHVLPKTFRISMRVTAEPNAAPDGTTIRAWLPIPRRYPFQYAFKLVSSSSPPRLIADEESPIRSIYFEQTARANQPTEFAMEYGFTTCGVYFDLKPEKVEPSNPGDETVSAFTREAPHAVFTPKIKALSATILGSDKNPLSQARKIHNRLAGSLQYSYSPEYSTIRNLSQYCLAHGYGDCGQQALLFITLCRFNGIPARWQSGWNLFPKHVTQHDWAEVHIAPCGWLPVDPYMGNYAVRYAPNLTEEERLEIRDFYFGGLDQYRMAANSDHCQSLVPSKKSPRSDDVDFQRGELEQDGRNIYFDQFSHSLNCMETPPLNTPAPI